MTGNVKSLIDFLAARLDEDEAITRRNLGEAGLGDDGDFPDYRTYSDEDTAAACDYLTHFAPLRQLREVAAKRKILQEHASVFDGPKLGLPWREGDEQASERLLQQLAEAYSEHPDYCWRWAT